jgi:hypothetical protein
MKIIFLDHDGVICLPHNWGSHFKNQLGLDDFDKHAVKVLNEILQESNAEIVISSDWRILSDEIELGYHYSKFKVNKLPYACTPDLLNDYPHLTKEELRIIEIKKWLELHPGITHWVAIDDLFLGKINEETGEVTHKNGLSNFVQTSKTSGLKDGGLKIKILDYLI